MIQIADKHECCGCGACMQICPKGCISLVADREGFDYPIVDHDTCIDCGLCENVCPVIHRGNPSEPLHTYAAINPDQSIRMQSSSGGIFAILAEKTIADGGVVFGARFADGWSVEHAKAETNEDLAAFRGSKYVQSRIGLTFNKAKTYLISGRKVLFSGTPCQISGLLRYLQRPYENLLTIDVVCHGVPSPMVWYKYLAEDVAPVKDIRAISFRNKDNGWNDYNITITLTNGLDNTTIANPFRRDHYMQAFLSNLSLRPSCYSCPAKNMSSGSDITLGDFWGIDHIHPQIDDNNGISLMMVNTAHGQEIIESLDMKIWSESYHNSIKYNPSVADSVSEPQYRSLFMHLCEKKGFRTAYKKVYSSGIKDRIYRKLWLQLYKQ